jgi:hypothetical protein
MLRRNQPDTPAAGEQRTNTGLVPATHGSLNKTRTERKRGHYCLGIVSFIVALYFLLALDSSDSNKYFDSVLKEKQVLFETAVRKGVALTSSTRNIELDSNVHLTVDFVSGSRGDVLSLGPHNAHATFGSECTDPHLWMRFEGKALVGVNLQQESNSNQWSGTFSLPEEGTYKMVAHWNDCSRKSEKKVFEMPNIKAQGMRPLETRGSTSLYPESAWIFVDEFHSYMWTDPKVTLSKTQFLKTSTSMLSKEGTVGENGSYFLQQLGNYELVCWIGSASAESLWTAFKEVKNFVAPEQRPFKFHHYPISSFVKPDQTWPDGKKKKFRKCKHILVSLDEMDKPVSQSEYKNQVETFLSHLVNAFPNETFPIWMHTVMESPEATANCHTPSLPRSSEHPCNVALKELFRDSPFPSRVHLFDNTDLTLPQLGENKRDVIPVVALRTVVFVGKKVKEWRESGQRGEVKGLRTGGTITPDGDVSGGKLEPNGELVPYTGWS